MPGNHTRGSYLRRLQSACLALDMVIGSYVQGGIQVLGEERRNVCVYTHYKGMLASVVCNVSHVWSGLKTVVRVKRGGWAAPAVSACGVTLPHGAAIRDLANTCPIAHVLRQTNSLQVFPNICWKVHQQVFFAFLPLFLCFPFPLPSFTCQDIFNRKQVNSHLKAPQRRNPWQSAYPPDSSGHQRLPFV